MSHHFISYSAVDALDVAMTIARSLEGGQPAIPVWLDKLEKDRNRLRPGEAWDEQIVEGIRTCDSLVFLMTPDSVDPLSVCKNEWIRALKYKKPVIPVHVTGVADMPFRLDPREAIELNGDAGAGLERLRRHLLWLASAPGLLRTLEYRLADAERDLRRADNEAARQRILAEIAELKQQIAERREIAEHPAGDGRRVPPVEPAVAVEVPPAPAPAAARCRVVNQAPGAAPSYFQDRHVETGLLATLIADEATRLVVVVGRGGVGKTAFACRVLKAIENGQAQLDNAPVPAADAIVYLSAAGARRVSVPHLYADLARLLPADRAQVMTEAFANPISTTTAKIEALLAEFQHGRVLVLLDNFEDVVDPQQLIVRDTELGDAIRAMLNAPAHAVKLVVTTRVAARDLLLEQPGRQSRIDLDEGLPSPYAENILRAMDVDGKLGLKLAPAELLDQARVRTRGYPRALEALFAILSADRDTSLADVLSDTAGVLPENVVRALVGEAFSRLDPTAQQIVQALAIFDRPVPAAAVDYLLEPHLHGVASTPILGRLVNMQFARKDGGRYGLHPVDREYALRRVPRGQPGDREAEPAVYSQLALLNRAADYFQQARSDSATWKALADLAGVIAEYDLRCDGENYAGAYRVLAVFDDMLLQWGHYRLSRELNARLDGKLESPELRLWVLRALGGTDSRLGHYARAIDYFEQALALTRELGQPELEAYTLYSIGWCHGELGRTEAAVEFSQQSLRVAESIGQTWAQADTLSLLGWYYGKLGLVSDSIEQCQRAVDMLRAAGANSLATALSNLAGVLLDASRFSETIDWATESLGVDPDSINLRNWNNGFIARAWLGLGDLARAREASERARASDEPENNPNVLVVLGIVCLLQGETDAAADAFRSAVTQADVVLEFSASFNALDARGVALAGVALCGDRARITDAADAHRAARAVNRDSGVLQRLHWLYDCLAPLDAAGLLDTARAALGVVPPPPALPGR